MTERVEMWNIRTYDTWLENSIVKNSSRMNFPQKLGTLQSTKTTREADASQQEHGIDASYRKCAVLNIFFDFVHKIKVLRDIGQLYKWNEKIKNEIKKFVFITVAVPKIYSNDQSLARDSRR